MASAVATHDLPRSKAAGKLISFAMENQRSVRVNFQVGMVPHKRLHNSHGVSVTIKDG